MREVDRRARRRGWRHAASASFVADVCEPYPIPIICELLGAPEQDWKLFSGWATDIFRIFNNDLADDLPADQGRHGASSTPTSGP